MEHTLKLEIPKGCSYEQLLKEREEGGKFIFFTYLIPLPWFKPIKRISRIYYLRPGENPSKYSRKYNLITIFWGWWGLPFGPAYTITTVKNNRTGTEITEDVFDNLNFDDFKNSQVIIKKASSIFMHPSQSSFKDISKCLKKHSLNNNEFKEYPIVGYYIDTEQPFYVIGLNSEDLINVNAILSELYKIFYKHIKFEFIDINDSSEFANKLKSQEKKITTINITP